MHQGANGQWRFTNATNHHFAASFNPFGNGDFALARQQLDTAHFAEIHPHRIIGARNITIRQIASGAAFFSGLVITIAFGAVNNRHAHLA